jgi:alpha-L-rhamnosidase
MNRRNFLQGASAIVAAPGLLQAKGSATAEQFETPEQKWIAAAEALKPELNRTPVAASSLVNVVADPSTFLQWRVEKTFPAAEVSKRLMKHGDSVILDFGRHLTGYLSFNIEGVGRGVDSPTRLKLIFGEVPAEVAEPFDRYTGWLSRAWLQDEVINIDVIPSTIHMPRRYAFRYLKVGVIATSPNYAARLSDFSANAVSSAGESIAKLPDNASPLLQQIDAVSIATLRDCMQTVFEDGPKRDRRLWIGDLRLQALTNYKTFRNFDLVKRCLYLFAAFPREDGLVAACAFEEPKPHRGHEYIIDYAALYGAAVVDYAHASNDWATAVELWPVVRRQMEILSGYVGEDHIFAAPPKSWVFIDWSDPLDRTAAMHGVFIYSLRYAQELAERAGAKQQAAEYQATINAMTAAARATFWDPARRLFVSGPKRQVSLASQAWMALSGVASAGQGAEALRSATNLTETIRPGGPYLYHYVTDAMIRCGMKQEALSLIQSYWGGMVKAGADTFWEVYDPNNARLSPYGDVLVNSYCHAWSCTPALLLRSGNLL